MREILGVNIYTWATWAGDVEPRMYGAMAAPIASGNSIS